MPTKPTDIDAYIAASPEEARAVLERMRAVIRKAAPKAEEMISYGIPAYKQHGTYVVYFAGYKQHTSLYPLPKSDAALRAELKPYEAGKGTLRFPLDGKLPVALITKVVKQMVKESAARAKPKTAAKRK